MKNWWLNKSHKFRRNLYIVVFFVFGLICFGLGYYLKPVEFVTQQALRDRTGQYRFISPLLAVGRPDLSIPSPNYVNISKMVKSYIDQRENSGLIDDASVYMINYSQNGSFAINENQGYDPASLMKIAIMLTYFNQSEDQPGFLNTNLFYSMALQNSLNQTPYDTRSELIPGRSYTVEDLINKMIIDSDNGAMNLLLASISDERMQQTYNALGIEGPRPNSEYKISAKDYSLFFRVLYNATFLSRSNSEKALSILSQAKFKDGLIAGLPAGTLVAHKFGEHINYSSGGINSFELHDCGIVYQPNNNYLLCIMTKGKKLTDLSDTIASITKMISSQK